MIRSKRFRLLPAPLRRRLYKRGGWYWYWTLVGNVRHGPADELRALDVYIRARRPLLAPARAFLLALIKLHLRFAAEGEPPPGISKELFKPENWEWIIHDTAGYEDEGVTEITFIPGIGRAAREGRGGTKWIGPK